MPNDLTQTTSPGTALVHMLDNRRDQFVSLLGGEANTDAFLRVVKNAIIRDPKIAEADQQSVFLECQKAAQDGLVLDGREAVLNRYNTRYKADDGSWQSKTTVAYIPMIAGIKKRVRNSGRIAGWNFGVAYAEEVRSNRFRFWLDDLGPHLLHQPFVPGIDPDRGVAALVYSVVRFKDGTVDYEVMNVEDVNAIRDRTKSKDRDGNVTGPWKTDWIEMAKKTVGRRHAKNLPLSSEDRSVVERVDALYDMAGDDVHAATAEAPASVRNKRKASAASKLQTAPAQQPAPAADEVDDETGEVIEADGMQETSPQPEPEDAF